MQISSLRGFLARFSEFDARKVILFQIKVFIKVTARPSFTQLRVIRQIEFIKYQNRKYVKKIQLYLLLI